MDRPLRLAFMGTPAFAVPTLEALVAAGHDIVAVYSQPPRPAGRGQKEQFSPVHQAALAAGLPVHTPRRLRDGEQHRAFAELALDAAVVVAYGLILPPAILWAPRLGCFNLHASLLPRWRGAAPIQRAIWAGDDQTGLAVMAMSEGLDEGPIVLEEVVPIGERDTAGSLHDRLAALGGPLMVDGLALMAAGRIVPRPQDEDGVTYARKIDKDEAQIDWAAGAVAIDRQVRALNPGPGAFTLWQGARLKVMMVEPLDGVATAGAAPGTVLDDRLTIACGDGAVRLAILQAAGRAVLPADRFLLGARLPPGSRLG